jgi:phosphate transport system substrate-binding protein
VEFIYALENHLSYARVENQAGEFVAADMESIAAAAANSETLDAAFKGSSVNPPGKASYPIITFTWLVVPAHISDDSKRMAMTDFLKWMLGQGQRQAATLGYMVLPATLVTREEAAIAKIQ